MTEIYCSVLYWNLIIYFEFIMTQVMHAVHNAVTCKGGNLRICPIHFGNASQPSHTVSVEEAHV